MKRIVSVLGFCLVTLGAANASAITMSTVVAQDLLLTSGNPGSSDADELAFVAAYLGVSADTLTYTKVEAATGSNWQQVTENDGTTDIAGLYAYDFGAASSAEYFLVKVGAGGGAGATASHFLYDNLVALRYGVVSLSDFGAEVSLTNISIISHAATVDGGGGGGGGGSPPEPASLALFGLGMFGAAYRLRKRTSAV